MIFLYIHTPPSTTSSPPSTTLSNPSVSTTPPPPPTAIPMSSPSPNPNPKSVQTHITTQTKTTHVATPKSKITSAPTARKNSSTTLRRVVQLRPQRFALQPQRDRSPLRPSIPRESQAQKARLGSRSRPDLDPRHHHLQNQTVPNLVVW
ncbi:hypothetical protein CMV_022029 [Castanea mollissima]|uniref:Uncharacterized protein n=1 Tax=Castanea mollissima TaxID=60419 RepID=A0A8J4V8H4_9ROSI|nr:hypothetical protein CMV_022029 [Castanea mollissima]